LVFCNARSGVSGIYVAFMTFMVRCARPAIAVLLAVGPALGAPNLEALRAASEQSFRQLSKLRAKETTTRGELDAVAGQIARSKGQAKGNLLPGRQLQDLLRRSQELSNTLTDLATAIATQESELQRRNGLLSDALTQEIARLRHDWEMSKGRGERSDLLRAMRSMRSEQQRIRATLPATTLPTFAGGKSSDDPEDLLEQADTLRDSADKVRRQLQALNAQIADAREQRDLERRMGEFLADQSIFDEHDRRFRAQSTSGVGSPGPTGGPVSGGSRAPGATDSPVPPSPQAAEVRSSALTESVRRDEPAFSQAPPGRRSQDNMQALETERRRLESLARQLELQAQALEQRARALQ
jgi:hypothetical protein